MSGTDSTGGDPEPGGVPLLLAHGRLEIVGRLTDASNLTLLGTVTLDGTISHCIYKPVRGERPLWDFPDVTLAEREVAAFAVSEQAGWHCVPPTALRDGPLGIGMVQQWIGPPPGDLTSPIDDGGEFVDILPADQIPGGWLPVFGALDEDGTRLAVCHRDDPRLKVIAVFDQVINNADRKAPHLVPTPSGRVLGVDHGLTFHAEDKLRTVLWGWAGKKLPDEVTDGLHRLHRWVNGDAAELDALTRAEQRRLLRRINDLLERPVFASPPVDRTPIPWPPL